MPLKAGLDRAKNALADVEVLDLVPRLTLVLFLLSDALPGDERSLAAPLRVLVVAGLVRPPWHRSPWLWGGVAALMTLKTLSHWWTQDNHHFLATYWCMGLAIALREAQPVRTLAWQARWLVGLCFAFAVLWKLALSTDFLDGTYFHYSLLRQEYFRDLAHLLGGLEPQDFEHNAAQAQRLFRSLGRIDQVPLLQGAHTALLARAMTWWTVSIELALALSFLVRRVHATWVPHALLLVFVVSTYSVAAVQPFGWLLIVLGLSQCAPEQRRLRAAYLAAYLLLAFYETGRPVAWLAQWLA